MQDVGAGEGCVGVDGINEGVNVVVMDMVNENDEINAHIAASCNDVRRCGATEVSMHVDGGNKETTASFSWTLMIHVWNLQGSKPSGIFEYWKGFRWYRSIKYFGC